MPCLGKCIRLRVSALVVFASLSCITTAAAQTPEGSGTPEALARQFYGALLTSRWEAVAELLHPVALDGFRDRVMGILDTPRSGPLRQELFEGASVEALRTWTGARLFTTLMESLAREMPGLVNSLLTNRIEVLGHVTEGDTLAHVVFRKTILTSGSTRSEIATLTVARERDAWRAMAAEELEVVAAALQGYPAGRAPPGSASATVRAGAAGICVGHGRAGVAGICVGRAGVAMKGRT